MCHARLRAMVDAPAPPRADHSAVTLPRGAAAGSANRADTAPAICPGVTGATRYSDTPWPSKVR